MFLIRCHRLVTARSNLHDYSLYHLGVEGVHHHRMNVQLLTCCVVHVHDVRTLEVIQYPEKCGIVTPATKLTQTDNKVGQEDILEASWQDSP
jgi:hypothetical protein